MEVWEEATTRLTLKMAVNGMSITTVLSVHAAKAVWEAREPICCFTGERIDLIKLLNMINNCNIQNFNRNLITSDKSS